VSEVLATADLYGAEPLKTHAADFIKRNLAAVMNTEGWTELVKNLSLINFVVCTIASA
jgi:hypothetical protein